MAKSKTSRASPSLRRATADEAALSAARGRLDRFVETLWHRWEATSERAGAAIAPSAVRRGQRDVERALADYHAGLRLRDTVAAALASAEARVAAIEAETAAIVGAAFKHFDEDRLWRKRRAKSGGARRRSRKAAANSKSPRALATLVADAKMATAYVIADRNRLIAWLVDMRAELAKLRERAGSPRLSAAKRATVLEEIAFVEHHEAHILRQLHVSATCVEQLLPGLRALIHSLPEPIARELGGIEAKRWPTPEDN